MKPIPISVLIVDDHEIVRTGLKMLIEAEEDLCVIGEAHTIEEALVLINRHFPRVVLLDLRLPDGSGITACQKILAVAPAVRILMLTSYADDANVVAAIQNGAHGYVLKDVRAHELINAIRCVAEGNGYLDPQIAHRALHWIRHKTGKEMPAQGLRQLSPQERLIMPLLANGDTNKEIAQKLGLSPKTVKNYLANIFEKLQVRRRTEAVAWYMKEDRLANALTGQ